MTFQLFIISVIFIVLALYSEISQVSALTGQLWFGRYTQIRNIDNLYGRSNQFSVGKSGTKESIYTDRLSPSFSRTSPEKTTGGLLPYPLSYKQGLLSTSLNEGDTQSYRYDAIYMPKKLSFGNQEQYGKQRGHSFATFWNYLPYNLPHSNKIQSLTETDSYVDWGEAEEEDFRFLFY